MVILPIGIALLQRAKPTWHSIKKNKLGRQISICGTTLLIVLATSNSAIANPFNCGNCNLKRFDLSSKQYIGAKHANLEGAGLRAVRMNGMFFTNANLRNANLRGVTPIKISLEGADLRGTKVDPNFSAPTHSHQTPFFCMGSESSAKRSQRL